MKKKLYPPPPKGYIVLSTKKRKAVPGECFLWFKEWRKWPKFTEDYCTTKSTYIVAVKKPREKKK